MPGLSDARRKGPAPLGLAVAGALWLTLFAVLFTLGEKLEIWPELAPGLLRDTDLAAGLLIGVAIGLVLLRSRARNGG